jgi:hypothetical protein
MIKTCHIEKGADPSLEKTLANLLARRNYLTVENSRDVDLKIVPTGKTLHFKHGQKVVIESSLKKFLDRPEPILRSFSKKCDRHIFFRQLTFFSLLLAFPLTLYFMTHALLSWIAGFFLGPLKSAILAALICLLAGILMMLPLVGGNNPPPQKDGIMLQLASGNWRKQVASLKGLAEQKQTWEFTPQNTKLSTSPLIPVRYWLARALAYSRGELTHATLIRLMDDPQPIVSCQALFSLGVRKKRTTVRTILDKIERSDDWYVQWYAFNALKALGWRQKIGSSR